MTGFERIAQALRNKDEEILALRTALKDIKGMPLAITNDEEHDCLVLARDTAVYGLKQSDLIRSRT